MKKYITNKKYIWLLLSLLSIVACNEPEDVLADYNVFPETPEELPALTAGSANFSKYVALGNSLTAGFMDGALFKAAQENSFPNILAQQFALAGGGSFNQPLTNDNFGGLAVAGTRIQNPRLVTTGGAPLPLESVIGPVTVSTDIALNNPTGPFNNLGVPGAKSFHLLANGYGNLANFPAAANPYFVRMTGSTPNASVLELAMAQNPSFFSLWIGSNDVLGYALSGGDGSNPITDTATFETVYNGLIATLTSSGAQGIVANVPYIENASFFSTVKFDALDPQDPSQAAYAEQIPLLNAAYSDINTAFTFLGFPERSIVFSETEKSPVVIHDEDLPDISAQLAAVLQGGGLDAATANLLGNQYGQARQATENEIILLTAAGILGDVNVDYYTQLVTAGVPAQFAGQLSVNGLTYPLQDKWVLLVNERIAIFEATDAYNVIIENAANSAGLAHIDTKSLIQQIAETGFETDPYIFTNDLVTGGVFSLDGLHPTSRGNALLANEFLKVIDAKYGSNFEASGNLVDVTNYRTNYSPLLQ
ncbi:G-D-S-L family lipolytic protein [Gaetbulibacter sp. M240]|uniref:G-D-S-L family lipolytic protein n=1 Tax=Gaetbulibacter sp. M240 TaxID=3126511 RepID=UPI00374FCCC3